MNPMMGGGEGEVQGEDAWVTPRRRFALPAAAFLAAPVCSARISLYY